MVNETAGVAATDNRRQSDADDQLHPRLAFILAGPSMAGSSDQHLPGVGTFAYNGSPVCDHGVPADGSGRQLSVTDLCKIRR